MNEQDRTSIRDALVAHVLAQVPRAKPLNMYGGIVFELDPGNVKSRIGGVYIYDGHVSLEISKGALLVSKFEGLLGQGKHRRHIKLTAESDLQDKQCFDVLDHAIRLHQAN